MNIERLKELRRFLSELPEETKTKHFDLETWALVGQDVYDRDAVPLDKVAHKKKLRDQKAYKVDPGELVKVSGHCGSSACAIGWACSNPVFNKEGLYMRAELTDGWSEEKQKYVPALDYFSPVYKGSDSWEAVVKFFDINYGQAYELFSDAYYGDPNSDEPYKATVEDVIQRLDNIINTGEVLPEMAEE